MEEENNKIGVNGQSKDTEDSMNLFDLTKDEETKNVTQDSVNTQKPNVESNYSNSPSGTSSVKNIYPTPQDDDKLATTRQEAQIQPEKPLSIKSDKLTAEENKPGNNTQATSRKSKNMFKLVLRIILFVIGSFIFVYVFLNFPALWKKASYYLKEKTGEKPQVQTIIPPDIDEDLLFLSTVTLYETPDINIKKEEEVKRGPTKDELGLNGIENNELWIPKIDVKAPIIWDSPVDDATMMENLKHGVVHYKGTTKPGEIAEDGDGNIFISGHSSYYWWDDGEYKTVFANLDQIEVGDEIGIGYDDYGYVYRVYEKKIVDPDDVSVLAQDTDKQTLTLMTCYPVGTDNQRLIVKAEYVARGKDEPEIIEETKEDITIEENAPVETPSPSPTPETTSTQTTVQNISSSYSKNFDVLDILPWNW